jgi:ParB family chromosome partitioning protein
VQPRTRFDETQLEELAQSIKTNGVVQPILVRKTKAALSNCRGRKKMARRPTCGLSEYPP